MYVIILNIKVVMHNVNVFCGKDNYAEQNTRPQSVRAECHCRHKHCPLKYLVHELPNNYGVKKSTFCKRSKFVTAPCGQTLRQCFTTDFNSGLIH